MNELMLKCTIYFYDFFFTKSRKRNEMNATNEENSTIQRGKRRLRNTKLYFSTLKINGAFITVPISTNGGFDNT